MLRRTVFRCAAASRRAELSFPCMHGFELKGVHRVDDLNLVTYEMVHTATAASYYHVDIDDTNNTFCIGFRTPAENNKGTSHVLEHTTLCGSQKYPVRDPFFKMLKRSLSSFMNAMTGADYTLYPFSTTNRQDFQNLLDIYLDAVFQPLLREEDFRQEGHRVETSAEEGAEAAAAAGDAAPAASPETSDKPASAVTAPPAGKKHLVHNGVVYNEMRGVVSEPGQHFVRRLLNVMLPDTHYTYVSGGYPPAILTLTYEELLSFHARHYHPSNSITFTYGSSHPAEHMAALDKYFSKFEKSPPVNVPTLTEAHRFKEPRVVQLDGPLDAIGNPDRQKRVSVSFGVPQQLNQLEDIVGLSVLDALLASGPSSPMYKALIESQIGSTYAPMRGYAYYLSSPIISYGVDGVDQTCEGTEEMVRSAVVGALQAVQRDGFDARRVRCVVFQEELQQRHRAADYGLHLCTGLCAMGLCRSSNSPLDFINWLPHLRKLEANNAADLLPRIDTVMLQNPHQAVVSVSAKKDFLSKLRGLLQKAEDDINANATDADIARVEAETAEWLTRVRAPQNLDVLPTLAVRDIPAKSFEEPLPQASKLNAKSFTITYPTNGLVYVHGLIPFSAALASTILTGSVADINRNVPNVVSLLAQTGAGKLSFKDFSVEAELVCGGFSFGPFLNESYITRGTTITGTSFGFYTTKDRLPDALDLLRTALLEPRTSAADEAVFTRVLSQTKMACSRSIQSLQRIGDRMAMTNAVSRLTRRGALRGHWWGLSQCDYASALLEKLQGTPEVCRETVEGLLREYEATTRAVAEGIADSTVWATCEPEHQAEVEQQLQRFRASFPCSPGTGASPRLTHFALPALVADPTAASGSAAPQRVLAELPIDTSFVGLAIPNELSWTDYDQAAVRVAALLLSNEYLHRRVREEGGAYGSGALATLQGEVGGTTMSSYRDPNPEQTIAAFQEAGQWLSDSANITEQRLTEAKLRLFASIDSPYAADSFGEAYFFNDVRQSLKQKMRDELLRVSTADVVRVADKFTPSSKAVISVLRPSESKE